MLPRSGLEDETGRTVTLVLDEAHTYTGAKGTEVAHLVRRLKERLGLQPGSHQFRAIATSASIPAQGDTVRPIRICPPCNWTAPSCAHVRAAGTPQSPGTDHALGRIRGGFGTQIHILADRRGRPLRLRVRRPAPRQHPGPGLGGSLDGHAAALPDGRPGL